MNRKVVSLLIGLCLLLVDVARSQTSQVKGKVVNPSGNSIEGASIKLVSSVDDRIGRKPEQRLSAADGSFRIPFDWAEIANGTQQGAVWELVAEKMDYASARASVQLVSGQTPPEVKIVLSSNANLGRLMSTVDACADPRSNTTTLYFFDFTNDSATPQKVKKFQELLLHKLRSGVPAKLQGAGLLPEFPFDIKACHQAPVTDESEAVFAGKRLGCPGVIYGFIEEVEEEKTKKYKSLVSFTVPTEPPLTDLASDVSSSDLSRLIEPSLEVGRPYLAFSSFVLGRLYLQAKKTELAVKCFSYAQANAPKSSRIAEQSEIILKQVQQNNPANELAPVGGPPP